MQYIFSQKRIFLILITLCASFLFLQKSNSLSKSIPRFYSTGIKIQEPRLSCEARNFSLLHSHFKKSLSLHSKHSNFLIRGKLIIQDMDILLIKKKSENPLINANNNNANTNNDDNILNIKEKIPKDELLHGYFYLQASYNRHRAQFKVKKHCSKNFFYEKKHLPRFLSLHPSLLLSRHPANTGGSIYKKNNPDKEKETPTFSLFGPTFINAGWWKKPKYSLWQFKLKLKEDYIIYEAHPSRILSQKGEEVLFRLTEEGRLSYALGKDKTYQLIISKPMKNKNTYAYLSIKYRKMRL